MFRNQIREEMFRMANPNLRVNGHNYEDFVDCPSFFSTCVLAWKGDGAKLPFQKLPNHSTKSLIDGYGHFTSREYHGIVLSRNEGRLHLVK